MIHVAIKTNCNFIKMENSATTYYYYAKCLTYFPPSSFPWCLWTNLSCCQSLRCSRRHTCFTLCSARHMSHLNLKIFTKMTLNILDSGCANSSDSSAISLNYIDVIKLIATITVVILNGRDPVVIRKAI